MKKRVKRFIYLVMCLVLLAGVWPQTMTVQADGSDTPLLQVGTAEELKEALSRDGDYRIRLTENITETVKHPNFTDWITLGSGYKRMNLNGFTVELNAESAQEITMFSIPGGASLFVYDGSEAGTGTLWVSGNMESVDHYYNKSVKYRTLFHVDGGKLTINSGTYEAGRSKKMYVFNGCEFASGKYRFDGYAWQQVNGRVIYEDRGEVEINGGRFIGRGFWKLEQYLDGDGLMCGHAYEWSVVGASLGSLTINAGEFLSRGECRHMSINDAVDLKIRSATFSANKLDYILFPRSQDKTADLRPQVFSDDSDDLRVERSHKTYHVPVRALDPERVSICADGVYLKPDEWTAEETIRGRDIVISPRTDQKLLLSNYTLDEMDEGYVHYITDDDFYWDPDSDIELEATFDDNWDTATTYTQISGHVRSTEELSVDPGVYINGEMHSAGGQGGTVIAEKDITKKETYEGAKRVKKFKIRLSDYAPAGFKPGDSFQLTVQGIARFTPTGQSDKVYNAAVFQKTIFVRAEKNAPVITAQPEDKVAQSPGATVTLTASAEGALGAYWERVYPASGIKIDPDSFTDGTATLTIPVQGSAMYRCVFYNAGGSAVSDAAHVYFRPEFDGNNYSEVTGYTQMSALNLYANANIIGVPYTTVEWLRGGTRITGDRYEINRNQLSISHPQISDSGEYVCRMGYKQPGSSEWEHVDYTINLTVLGADPEYCIENVNLLGVDGLYFGADAPSTVSCDDMNVDSVQINWIAGVYNGKIDSTNPVYTLTLTAKQGYVFKLDTNGNFHYSMDGLERTVYGGEAGEEKETLVITYTYDNHHALPYRPSDEIVLNPSTFVLSAGDEVDETFGFELVCPAQHETSHRLIDVELKTSLPSGLTLKDISISEDGKSGSARISGTLAEAASVDPFITGIDFVTDDVQPVSSALFFAVNPTINRYSLPLPKLHTEHTFGDWSVNGEGVQVRTCELCGYTETRDETGLHEDDDAPMPEFATVSFQAGEGSGSMENIKHPVGTGFLLPECTFDAPGGKEFYAWQTGNVFAQPGTEIELMSDLSVMACWKAVAEEITDPGQILVSFESGEGSGTMDPLTVTEGLSVGLPKCRFTAPENKVFYCWKTGGISYKVGETMYPAANVSFTAVWKDEDAVRTGISIEGLYDSYSYTGKPIIPDLTIYDGETLLKAGTDYTLSLKNNTAVNEDKTAKTSLTIKFKGDRNGSINGSFTITRAELNTEDQVNLVYTEPAGNVNGKLQKLKPQIWYKGRLLKQNKDYTLTWPSEDEGAYKNTGDWPVAITGKGSFSGGFTIYEHLGDKTVLSGKGIKCTMAKKADVLDEKPMPTLTDGTYVLTSADDYTVKYINSDSPGTAVCIATAKAGSVYIGSRVMKYKVNKANLKSLGDMLDISINNGKSVAYAPGGAKPDVKVSLKQDGKNIVLNPGTDYKLKYSNNKAAGKNATVSITGIGRFSGTAKKTFPVTVRNLSALAGHFYVADVAAGGTDEYKKVSYVLFDTDGTRLKAGRDFDASYTEPDETGIAVITLTGKGNNYRGTVSKKYRVIPDVVSIEKAKLSFVNNLAVIQKDYAYTGEPVCPGDDFEPVLELGSGTAKKTLHEGDYEITAYENNMRCGTATIIIRGKGDYCGLGIFNFKIVPGQR